MANTEDVEVIQIRFDTSGQSIGELREGLKKLKEDVNKAEIGTQDFIEASKALAAQEVILKDAMYQQQRAVNDGAQSYASLSKEMAKLKAEQKQLNISTVEGMETFDDYAKRINAINDQLKELDEKNGVYTRNVGDYANQFSKGFKNIVADMPSWTNGIRQGVDDIGKSFGLLSKNPIVGVASLLAPVIMQIAAGLKENETALGGVRQIMDAIQPVFNVLNNALEKAVGWVAEMVGRLGELAGESTGTFKGIVTGAVGVGNAVLQFLLTPIRTVIEAAKGLGNVFSNVFRGQFKEAASEARTALAGIGDAFTKGFAFKANFEAGQKIGEEFAAGIRSDKTKATTAAAVKEVVEEAVAQGLQQADIDKALSEADRKADEARRKRMEERKMVDEWFADEDAAIVDEINAIWEEQQAADAEATKQAEENAKKRVSAIQSAAGATSNILTSLADMFDANADADEKATKQGKALRIAAATIDMLQGAVTAFSTAQQLGPIAGPIVGATNAAAVIAAGVANIAKIRNTQVSKSATSSGAPVAAVSPVVSAPTQAYTPPEQLRTITSASEEERLNRMADAKRVYILQSDIEAAGHASKVQVDESTF